MSRPLYGKLKVKAEGRPFILDNPTNLTGILGELVKEDLDDLRRVPQGNLNGCH